MGILTNLLVYLASFVVIWIGSGLIIKSVDKIAHKLRVSSFAISFFLLGILTSIPEMAIGINAVLDHNPEVFVGTFLGGSVVIFLLVIPLLAILGKGIKLNHDLDTKNLIGLLTVIAAPAAIVIDNKVSNFEGLFLILSYATIFYFIERMDGVLEKKHNEVLSIKAYSFLDILKVGLGIGMVFVSSQVIVSQTLDFAKLLSIPAFYISIIVLSLGTNLPELSIAVRAIMSGKKDIAFGDYLGSAAANTLLFGIFTLTSGGEVLTYNSFIVTFLFIITGLGLFYYFSQSKKDISKKEGIILLAVYFAFVIYEVGSGLIG